MYIFQLLIPCGSFIEGINEKVAEREQLVCHQSRGWFNIFRNRDTKIDLKMRRNMMNQTPISKRIVCQNEDTPF